MSNKNESPAKEPPVKPQAQPERIRTERLVEPLRVPDGETTVVRKSETPGKDVFTGK